MQKLQDTPPHCALNIFDFALSFYILIFYFSINTINIKTYGKTNIIR